MGVSLQHDRWAVAKSDFAVRIIVPDLKGYFEGLPYISGMVKARSLVVEPGTRALLIDEGVLVGEIPPGTYTIETFLERLQFWRNKQVTVFLTRSEDVVIDGHVEAVPCLDNVCFDVDFRWAVQMADVLPFLNNLMGANEAVSIAELQGLISPIVNQAVISAIGSTEFDTVRSPGFQSHLSPVISEDVNLKFQRYGLRFTDLHTFQPRCDDHGQSERRGDVWLRQRETDLQRAALKTENANLAVHADETKRKVEIRNQLRNVVSSDELHKIKTKEDFQHALLNIDRARLLREEEKAGLISAFVERNEDRQNLRQHLVETIDLQREQEVEELRVQVDYAVKMRALEQEIVLTRLAQTKDAETWRNELQQEKERAAHRRDQKLEDVRASLQRVRELRRQKRDDAWEKLLHHQKLAMVRGDMELTQQERNGRVAIMQAELSTRLDQEKLELEKRRSEWELDLGSRKSQSQMERLQQVQRMNAEFAERQMKMQLELENLKADSAGKRELERMQAMSTLGTDVLIATAGTANAALLADLKKHEATTKRSGEDSEAVQAARNKMDEERLRLYEKMNETERAKADAVAEAFRMAMQSQQANVSQMIGGLAQVATPPAHTFHAFPGAMAPPSMQPGAHWCVSLNGQQSPPLQPAQLQQYIQSGQVNSQTMVWRAGMASWIAAGTVPELAAYFGGQAGSPPPV